MVSLKDRRNSGKYTPTTNISRKELIQNNIEIPIEYDDWQDHRDGMRDWYRDGKMIKKVQIKYHRWNSDYDIKRAALNNKQEKLLQRRKARHSKTLNS